MTAFTKFSDIICVQSTEAWDGAGTNFRDNRSSWFNCDDASVQLSTGKFTIPGGTTVTTSDWNRDDGPNTLDKTMQEGRAFCLRGMVTIQFTGSTLVLRVNTDWGWGTAHKVYIDGVVPSTIPGILAHQDTVSCDSATYQLESAGYADVLLADGLSAGQHTCTIYVNQLASSSLYFSMVGYKVYGFASQPLKKTNGWIVPTATQLALNKQTLSLVNKGSNTIVSPSLSFPAGLVNGAGAALTPLAAATLASGAPLTQEIMPAFTGNEMSGEKTYALTLTGQYLDPAGTIQQTVTSSINAQSSALIVTGGGWSVDNATPDGRARIYASATPAKNNLQFTFQGDALSITVEQDYGWGIFGLYDSTGTTLLQTITCNADNTGFYTANFTGFGAGSHTVMLKKTLVNTKPVVFISASWSSTTNYSQITETVNVVIEAGQPYALPVQNVVEGPYALQFDAPVQGALEQDGSVVRQNNLIAYTEVLERFPTYAVCYQPGYADVLSGYDVLIVDPFAAKAEDVLAWQAMGIQVYGYISLGEEDGFYTNRYDFTGATGPYPGDGAGPGGMASYYLKGGYQARECTECTFDNQAVAGTKTCAQAQPMYFMGIGRCSGACSLDSLNGYAAFSTGGACGGGYTSANNWIRPDANTACTNGACPKYKPVHQLQTGARCPKYQQVDGAYLQDFSLANPTIPDQNGIWSAFYADVGKPAWLARIMSYYAPTVLGGPVTVTNETVTVKTAVLTTDGSTVFVFDTAQCPIDESAPITLTTTDGVTSYQKNTDYSFDMKTGAFVFNAAIATPVTAGQHLTISYVKKGHRMDGIFMDTVDDSDVYPTMGPYMAKLVNDLKAGTGTKLISNRGFTNMDSFIQSCEGVMFESWLVDWDENTGDYFKITDPDSVKYNQDVNDQLTRLRKQHVFDVYSLNYCNADASGDALRAYCTTEDRKRGYLSWTSTIALNSPAGNQVVETPGERIKTNAFRRTRIKRY
jgi:hypothetical protein